MRYLTLLFTAFLFVNNAFAQIDPPSRVARLSFIKGEVSFSPAAAKNNVWVVGRVNRPLVTGDRIWVDTYSRAELQLGSAAVRIFDKTSLRVMKLNDQVVQLDLQQGSLILHVRQIKSGQIFEIDTPQLAFRISQTGDYRFDVADNGDATTITVRKGDGYAYAKNAAFRITASHAYRFTGKNLQSKPVAMRSFDSFDKWSVERENRATKSRSIKYVSTTIIGYEDLDNYGNWRYTPEFGYVWTPNRTPAGWAPYRYGHWSWIDPWGWTWIDDQPWGFAPSHYGRWAHYKNVWVWIPGPRTAQSTYAPALVVFVGGNKQPVMLNSDPAVAWFPLGPNDVYVPPYTVSKTYFTNVNVTNTTINQVQITNVYHNQHKQVNYTNYQINNAITAVPTKTFIQSQSTAKTAMPVPTTVVGPVPASTTPVVAPSQQSSTGYEVTTSKPSESTLERTPVEAGSNVTGTYSGGDSAKSTETSTGSNVSGTYSGGDSAETKTEKEAAEKAEADKKAELDKAQAEKAAAEQIKADHEAATAKLEAEKQAAEKVEADKAAAAAKAEADRQAEEKAEADKAAAHAEAQQRDAEAAKIEAEKQAAEKAETERAAAQAAEAAKAEAERQAAQEAAAKAEAEKAEAEKAAAEAEAEQQAAVKAEAEQAAAEKAEAERQAAEAAAPPQETPSEPVTQ